MAENESAIPPNLDGVLLSDQVLYFNGFSMGVGAGDVIITLLRQSKPVVTLNASYTVAKTLGKALSDTIQTFEKQTNHVIMTVKEVHEHIERAREK